MTKEELAEKLNGIDYRRDIPEEFYPVLVENNLCVVLGGSDDLCYFLFPKNGKVEMEELPCWEGEIFWFDKNFKKFLNAKKETMMTYYDNIKENCNNSIEAVWCNKNIKSPDGDYYSWTYKTQIPHATFNIMQDEMYYCKAIVFNVSDLK